jgi:hypothetical protein
MAPEGQLMAENDNSWGTLTIYTRKNSNPKTNWRIDRYDIHKLLLACIL